MSFPLGVFLRASTGDLVQWASGWGFHITSEILTSIAHEAGEESIIAKTGGAPTLTVGMAHIFHHVLGGGGACNSGIILLFCLKHYSF